jgi:hypothetical protein
MSVDSIYDNRIDLMERCLHLYMSGQQCDREAFSGDNFCEDHADVHPIDDAVGEHPFKKVVLRVVALILLVMFLIPIYYTLRTLYLDPQVQVQEGG